MKELASKQLSRYALRKELSHKAGRRTFLATDLETQTPVIVKVLQLGKGFQWDDLKLFEREAKILSRFLTQRFLSTKTALRQKLRVCLALYLCKPTLRPPRFNPSLTLASYFLKQRSLRSPGSCSPH